MDREWQSLPHVPVYHLGYITGSSSSGTKSLVRDAFLEVCLSLLEYLSTRTILGPDSWTTITKRIGRVRSLFLSGTHTRSNISQWKKIGRGIEKGGRVLELLRDLDAVAW